MERPVCAMEDESAIFIRNGKAEIIGAIHKIDKGEIRPLTEERYTALRHDLWDCCSLNGCSNPFQ